MAALDDLYHDLLAAGGCDPALDTRLVEILDAQAADYTASVEACLRLVASALPGWRLHIGYSVSGMFPYASLTDDRYRFAAEAPTVPLAILRAMVGALRTLPAATPAAASAL